MSEGGGFGISLAAIVAGFFGSVVSLIVAPPMTRTRAVLSVMAGTAASMYLTPISAEYLHLNAELQGGLSFLIGLTAMKVLPRVLRASETATPAIIKKGSGND